jgi:hypothetical protein
MHREIQTDTGITCCMKIYQSFFSHLLLALIFVSDQDIRKDTFNSGYFMRYLHYFIVYMSENVILHGDIQDGRASITRVHIYLMVV